MKLTARQQSDILSKIVGGAENTIPGSCLIDGTLAGSKLTPGSVTTDRLDPTAVARWDLAYNLRVDSWTPPLLWNSGVVSMDTEGVNADVAVLTSDGGPPRTVILKIRNGRVVS